MYIRKNIGANKRIYLSLVQGYRDVNGVSRQKLVENLGYLDDLQKIYDDPIAHFKEVAKQKSLEYSNERKFEFEYSKNAKLESGVQYRKNLGYSIPKKIYNELDIGSFFQKKQRTINAEYNLNSIFSLLIFNRILKPSSKKKAFETKDMFFDKFNFELEDVYRSLTFFNRFSLDLQKHLNEQVEKNYGRNKTIAYYDVTNFYFEIPYDDEDIVEDGMVVKKELERKVLLKSIDLTP